MPLLNLYLIVFISKKLSICNYKRNHRYTYLSNVSVTLCGLANTNFLLVPEVQYCVTTPWYK